MKKWISVPIVIIIISVSFASGFMMSSSNLMWGGDEVGKVELPQWEKGRFWVYAFSTIEIENTLVKIVCADMDSNDYELGINNRLDAQRHAVLNYDPMLGRITRANLAIYEKGIVQTVLLFPLQKGKTWRFDLLGITDLEAKVESLERTTISGEGKTTLVDIVAKSDSSEVLRYTYDSSAKWIRSMTMIGADSTEQLRMTMVSYGTNYKGDVYFIRGVDLFDKGYHSGRGSPEVHLYDTFVDSGHPDWGPFDSLIYYYTMTSGSNSNALMTVRDHSTTTMVRKVFGSGTLESGLGSMDSNAGQWGVSVSMQGVCDLQLRIAGGIEYNWSL